MGDYSFTAPGCWEGAFADAVLSSSSALSLSEVSVRCPSLCYVGKGNLCSSGYVAFPSPRTGSWAPTRCAEVNFIHIRAHSASQSSVPACVLPRADLEKPVGPVTTGAGAAGAGLPLLVGRVCCPAACPQWPWWARGLGCPVAVLRLPRGCPAAARGEPLVAALHSQLSGERWPSSAPAAPAAASGLLPQKGALSGLQYFLWALAVFLWDSRHACELGMPGYACLEKPTKQKELGDEEQKGSVLPSPSLASGPSCKADLGSPERAPLCSGQKSSTEQDCRSQAVRAGSQPWSHLQIPLAQWCFLTRLGCRRGDVALPEHLASPGRAAGVPCSPALGQKGSGALETPLLSDDAGQGAAGSCLSAGEFPWGAWPSHWAA